MFSLSGCGGEGNAPDGSSADSGGDDGGGGLSSLFGGGDSSESGEESSASGGTRKTGDTITNSLGMKLGVIPPGEYFMGSPDTEEKRSGDESRHRVKLTKPIFMGTHEVTQAEFQAVMESNPSGITDSDTLPVQNVSWEQAVAFCRKLSELPDEKAAGREYRLPTEAEWEYACRAGSTTPGSFGGQMTSALANFDGNYPYGTETAGTFVGKPQVVGSYEANAWGLFDMHGNVWEWCHDWYAADYYRNSTADDPQGPESGISHVIRGGSWYNFGYTLRSAYRSEFTPPLEANIYGFRVVSSFGKGDTFEASELDNPNPVPMTPTPEPPAVASTSGSSPGMTVAATSTTPSMTDSMRDSDSMSESASTSAESPREGSASLKQKPSAGESRPRQTDGAGVVTPRHVILLPLALLVLLSLVEPGGFLQKRHGDLLPFFLIALASVVPDPTVQIGLLWVVAIAVGARLLFATRNRALPKAVVPNLSEKLLLAILVSAFAFVSLLQLATGPDVSFPLRILAVANSAAIAAALVLIGQRWKNRTLGYSLALVWLVLPAGNPPLAAALILWAFVFLNRGPLAGVLTGCAIAMSGWLCCLIPLWASFYRGRARSRFLTTSGIFGIGGWLALWVLPQFFQISDLRSESGGSTLMFAATLLILGGAAAATWFRPTEKTESTVVVYSAVLLLCVFACSRTASSAAMMLPWLALVLVGGCASRGRAVVTEGTVLPFARRLVQSSKKAGSSTT